MAVSEMIKSQDQETLSEQENTGRRRLVRGVVALAPLVLTLRSGAAAASCTGAKALRVTLDGNGKVPNADALGVRRGDVCYLQSQVDVCSEAPPKLQNPAGTPASYTVNSSLRCGDNPNTLSPGTQVAILSSQAASSFLR